MIVGRAEREQPAAPARGQLAAVLWDMDGTLVDSHVLWQGAYQELAAQLGLILTPTTWRRIAGRTIEASVQILGEDLGRPLKGAEVESACTWLTTHVCRLLESRPSLVRWMPGARQALQVVQHAAVPTALVTTTWRDITVRMMATLGVHFDTTVCGDEILHGKPAPDCYLRAAELLGVEPADCVAVEDSATGVRAATEAGAAVLAVPSHGPIERGARRVIRSSLAGLTVAELTTLVRRASREYGAETSRSPTEGSTEGDE
ncbi:MAG: HAD family hydrolase [Pseudonocardiaceae bacterium]